MNLIDLFGITPYYLSLIVAELEDMQIIGKVGNTTLTNSIIVSGKFLFQVLIDIRPAKR